MFLLQMQERFLGDRFVWVDHNPFISNPPQIEIPFERIRFSSLYEYWDALGSAKALLCSEAGAQALGSAATAYNLSLQVVSLISTKTFNSRGYTFSTNDYFVTSHCSNTQNNNQQDFWYPPEIPYTMYQMYARNDVAKARDEWDSLAK
jgi:hypothetical protein